MDDWLLLQQPAPVGSPLAPLPVFAGETSEGYTSSISIDGKLFIHIWIIQHCFFHNQGLVLLLPSKLAGSIAKEIAAQVVFHKATRIQLMSQK